MKKKLFLKCLAYSIFIFAVSCADDEFEAVEGLCPLVIATLPIDGSINVPLDQVISATFNKPMDISTINAASFTITGQVAIDGSFSFETINNQTNVLFTPSGSLEEDTTYTGRINTTVKDADGNALQISYVWSFATGSVLAPTVIATNPTDTAVNIELDQTITVVFSEAVEPGTINNSTIMLTDGNNAVSGTFSFNGAEVSFNPTTDLLPETLYTGTITTGVENMDGVALESNYVWSFTTKSIVAPTVVITDPIDNATGVQLDKVITATFSQIMNPATFTASTFTIMNGPTAISGTFSFSGAIVSFTPTTNLDPNTTYTVTITTGTENMIGVALENNYVWNFQTLAIASNPPDIGTLSEFGGFGGNAGLTNQGLNTVINNGGIGTTAASTLVTGFHDGITNAIYTETPLNVGLVTGGIFTAPPAPGDAVTFAAALQASLDAIALYNEISPASMPGGTDPGAGELGGLTLAPGIYKSASGTFNITNGDLTLDAQGDPNAVWVFQTAAGLTVGIAGPNGAKSVNLINGASSSNVFWHIGSAATINSAGGGVMVGTIVANSGVTLSTAGNAVQTVLNGRAISLIASVTMVNTTVNVPN